MKFFPTRYMRAEAIHSDIVWNPSSSEDMQYFSDFMEDALKVFQGMVNRDFALSIEPYVFMYNLS